MVLSIYDNRQNQVIGSFADELTSKLFEGTSDRTTKHIDQSLLKQIKRRLDVLNSARQIEDLMVVPANRFHALSGKLNGYFAISVNKQWQIIFTWKNDEAHNVKLTDYH